MHACVCESCVKSFHCMVYTVMLEVRIVVVILPVEKNEICSSEPPPAGTRHSFLRVSETYISDLVSKKCAFK